jgi:diguanylate cyclase (GGDEF)-like protein/PAS domain S-box-containing protein
MDDNKLAAIDLADVMELMLDAVCVVDREGYFVFVSAAFEHMFGYRPDEVIGKPMVDLVFPEDRGKTLGKVNTIIDGEIMPRFENRWVRKDGQVLDILWSARWSEKHQVRIAVAHDITERKQMEAKLLYAAGHDALTDLPNRPLFLDRLQSALTFAEREKTVLSVMFVDIDGFKAINDAYGHAIGDKLLQEIAHCLQASVRKSDTVGRFGGDEFLLVLNKTYNNDNVMLIADKIRKNLAQAFVIDGFTLQVSSSIGIASYPENGERPLDLVQYSDQAMYRAKKSGGNKVVLFGVE